MQTNTHKKKNCKIIKTTKIFLTLALIFYLLFEYVNFKLLYYLYKIFKVEIHYICAQVRT